MRNPRIQRQRNSPTCMWHFKWVGRNATKKNANRDGFRKLHFVHPSTCFCPLSSSISASCSRKKIDNYDGVIVSWQINRWSTCRRLICFPFFGFQSLQSNQEATELLENVRKSKEQLQTHLEKLQVQYNLDQSLWLFSSVWLFSVFRAWLWVTFKSFRCRSEGGTLVI